MKAPSPTNYTATRVQAFFWWCAGANREILQECPTDQMKYTALGIMTCLAGCVASVSGGSFAALTLRTGSLATVAIGLAWGLLIFNLDRLLLVAARKTRGEGWRVLPRFLLALALALLIGEPLLMRLFAGEIAAELADRTRQHAQATAAQVTTELQPRVDATKADLKALREQLQQLKQRRDDAETAFIGEKEGVSGTKRPGAGPVYKEKLEAYQRAKSEYEAAKPKLEEQITAKEAELAGFTQQVKDIQATDTALQEAAKGGLAQHKALYAIVRHDAGAALLYIPLFLALLMLEVTPLVAKTFAPVGPYDKLLLAAEAQGVMAAEAGASLHEHERVQQARGQEAHVTRIMDAIVTGQLQVLTDPAERQLAEQLRAFYTERLRRTMLAGEPRPSVTVPPIAIEVANYPDITTQLSLPPECADATLEDLEGDLAWLANEISGRQGQPWALTGATSAQGQEVQRRQPLWPQLAPEAKLQLKFTPLTAQGLPLT